MRLTARCLTKSKISQLDRATTLNAEVLWLERCWMEFYSQTNEHLIADVNEIGRCKSARRTPESGKCGGMTLSAHAGTSRAEMRHASDANILTTTITSSRHTSEQAPTRNELGSKLSITKRMVQICLKVGPPR